ncbi:DinB family protein [Aggregatilinea lenta]|uniref:DinB family protein n=1 Tax=Aggregatilinea lenta TaxID=913108 RepID=UPI000E5AAD91|nr:DinB family protein [Aggregatilinea lenta]
MTKTDVIADLRGARESLLQAIDGLSDEQMYQVGAVGIWSVKDVLGHLVAWEAELVTTLARLDQYKRKVPQIVEIEDIDEWNEEQYRVNVARGLDVIVEDFHGVHKHLVAAIEALDERMLEDNRAWPWMEGEPLSYLIAENATWHEQEHADDIRQWREEVGI